MLKPRKAQIIKELFPITNGLFSKMNYTFRDEVTKASLDVMFVANCGLRNPSPVVETIQDEYGEQLTSEELTTLAAIILEMYKPKWDKMGEIYDIQYDPIHNYLDEWEDTSQEEGNVTTNFNGTKTTTYGKTDTIENVRTDALSMDRTVQDSKTETRTDDLEELETRNLANSGTRTDNLLETETFGKTNTRTDNLTEALDSTTSGTGSQNETASVWGFNSANAVNSDATTGGNTSSETVDSQKVNTGTQANAEGGSNSTANTGTQQTTGSDTGTVRTENTGTEQNVSSGTVSESVDNTGTRTTEITDTLSGIDTVGDTERNVEDSTRDRDRSGRHFGNIGNLTSQKQILEEISLWRWNYMNEIINDVKDFCTLPVYRNATAVEWVPEVVNPS